MVNFVTFIVAATAIAMASARVLDVHPIAINTTDPNLTARANNQDQYLDAHNAERDEHGAVALVWNDDLASSAQAWASQCQFKHSQSGQNLYAATGNPPVADAVAAWNAERDDYEPSNPRPSHWTQVVWKNSTELGCASYRCPRGTIFDAKFGPATYVVCHYSPAGNVADHFPENVQK